MHDISMVFDDELHTQLRCAAEVGPLARDTETGTVLVLRHADVERLAFDRALAGVGLSFFDLMGIADGPLRRWYGSLMFTTEGPRHQRLRSLVSRAFTPRAVEAMRVHAAALSKEAFDVVAADGGGDLVEATGALPIRVMCRLLGVPAADVDIFWSWAESLSPVFAFMEPHEIDAATTAVEALLDYVDRLATARRGDPGDDLITALLQVEDGGDRLEHATLVDMVANLLVAGHDTTASQLACTLLTLVRHPETAAAVRQQPDLLASATNETIRFEPSVPGVPRTVVAPVVVGDDEVEPGTVLVLSTAAANREPGVWRDPDRVDAARFADPDAPRVLSFGAGTHYCLGAALARLTIEEVVRSATTLGTLSPAEDTWALPWRNVLGRAPVRVPVEVT